MNTSILSLLNEIDSCVNEIDSDKMNKIACEQHSRSYANGLQYDNSMVIDHYDLERIITKSEELINYDLYEIIGCEYLQNHVGIVTSDCEHETVVNFCELLSGLKSLNTDLVVMKHSFDGISTMFYVVNLI